MVRLRDSWRFSLASAPTVGNPCRPLQPESVSDQASSSSELAFRLDSRAGAMRLSRLTEGESPYDFDGLWSWRSGGRWLFRSLSRRVHLLASRPTRWSQSGRL